MNVMKKYIKDIVIFVCALVLGCIVTNIYIVNTDVEVIDDFTGTYSIKYINNEEESLTLAKQPDSEDLCYYKFSVEKQEYEYAIQSSKKENCISFYNDDLNATTIIVYTNGRYYFIENNEAISLIKNSNDPIIADFIND